MADFIPTLEGENPEAKRNTFAAFLAYILFLLPLITKARNDPFVIHHVRQSFILLALLLFTKAIFNSLLGWYAVSTIFYTIIFILWCLGVTFVFLGKSKPLPGVGWLAKKLPF